MKPQSEHPRLAKGSVLHTDSAKAYKTIGMQRWPEAGALHGDFEADDLFKDMQYVHTNVSHKKKVGVPQQFVVV